MKATLMETELGPTVCGHTPSSVNLLPAMGQVAWYYMVSSWEELLQEDSCKRVEDSDTDNNSCKLTVRSGFLPSTNQPRNLFFNMPVNLKKKLIVKASAAASGVTDEYHTLRTTASKATDDLTTGESCSTVPIPDAIVLPTANP